MSSLDRSVTEQKNFERDQHCIRAINLSKRAARLMLRIKRFTSCPLEASSSKTFLVLMYCDPPMAWNPTIRAEKADLTNSKAKSSTRDSDFVEGVTMLRLTSRLQSSHSPGYRSSGKGHTLSPFLSRHPRVVTFKLPHIRERLLPLEYGRWRACWAGL